jgi:hypothetical protein
VTNPLDQALAATVTTQGGPSNAVAMRRQIASELIGIALQWPVQIANQLNDVMNRVWGSSDPQKVCDEIDRQRGAGFCATMFAFHKDLSEFIVDRFPSLADKLVKRPPEYSIEIDEKTSRVIITETEQDPPA